MKKTISAVIIIFSLICASQAMAHSTQGRLKITLKKKLITTDDVAYYIESYVNRQKYKDAYIKTKNRFIVDEFLTIEQDQAKAKINIRVLDKKLNKRFDDFVILERTEKGHWQNPDQPGKNVYTYVGKSFYYYTHYLIPALGIAAVLASLNYLFQRFVNRKEKSFASGGSADGQTFKKFDK